MPAVDAGFVRESTAVNNYHVWQQMAGPRLPPPAPSQQLREPSATALSLPAAVIGASRRRSSSVPPEQADQDVEHTIAYDLDWETSSLQEPWTRPATVRAPAPTHPAGALPPHHHGVIHWIPPDPSHWNGAC